MMHLTCFWDQFFPYFPFIFHYFHFSLMHYAHFRLLLIYLKIVRIDGTTNFQVPEMFLLFFFYFPYLATYHTILLIWIWNEHEHTQRIWCSFFLAFFSFFWSIKTELQLERLLGFSDKKRKWQTKRCPNPWHLYFEAEYLIIIRETIIVL